MENEKENVKLPILSIIGLMGLISLAFLATIQRFIHLEINGLGGMVLIGSISAFFSILILLGVIDR